MYDFNGIIVSGDHIIYENNKPIRVCESKISKPVYYNKNKLIC